MSWLFSRALVAASLGVNSLGGGPSVPSNLSPGAVAYSLSGKMTEFWTSFRFGAETFGSLTEDQSEAVLTWCRADSHAKTSAQPILTLRELPVRVQASGKSSFESFAKWVKDFPKTPNRSSGWKTHQCSLDGDLESYSETWPRSGIMQSGACWELTTSVVSTSGNDCSYWATPLKRDWKDSPGMDTEAREGERSDRRTDALPRQVFAFWPTPLASDDRAPGAWSGRQGSQGLTATMRDAVAMWPTPIKADSKAAKKFPRGNLSLWSTMKLWPTPTVHGNTNFKGAGPKSGNGLGTEVMDAFGPTPNLSSVETAKSAPLNPEFVEWLMGFPLGWTASAPLETHKFQQWLPQHFNS